ncbi:MAG: hypothetical protein AAGA50_27635 [Pseudomonadota bacterium]
MKHKSMMQWQSKEQLQLDDNDQVVLEIARYFFMSWAARQSRGWEEALAKSNAAFGPIRGQSIAFALLDALIQMRDARKNLFVFNNPRCEKYRTHITHCERHLLSALQQTKRGRQSAACVDAMILCEGNEMTAFIERLRDLSAALEQ